MRIRSFILLSALVPAGGLAGCQASSNASPEEDLATVEVSLLRAQGCDDLLGGLRRDAIVKLNKGIDVVIRSVRECVATYGESQCSGFGYYGGGYYGEDTRAEAAAPPAAAGSAANSASDSGSKASSYSETNTQVRGVDEADFVKTDGQKLYVINGNQLKVVQAWPANELKELTSTKVEGAPTEMFLSDGKLVVYSQVNGSSILKEAGVSPKSMWRDFVAYPTGGGFATGGVAVDAPIARDSAAPSGVGVEPEAYVPLTKITVFRLDGAQPIATRELYFEGSYLDARRVNSFVRTVLQGYGHGPRLKSSVYELLNPTPGAAENPTKDTGDTGKLPSRDTTPTEPVYPKTGTETIALLEQLRRENTAIINASPLDEWLPYSFERVGGAVSAQRVACEGSYFPNAGTTASGLSVVSSIDLNAADSSPQQTLVFGQADTVYGSRDAIYLAARGWTYPPQVFWGPSSASSSDVSSSGNSASKPATRTIRFSTSKTHIHKFDFAQSPSYPNYVASGTVPGAIKDQFSLDDREGNLRIATTESFSYLDEFGRYVSADFADPSRPNLPLTRPSTVNRVFVLSERRAPGAVSGRLAIVGDAGELAPGERIYSTRFVGTRGYVVTFRQVDPLFVLDLADPTKPTVLAALKIDGFSEYMHPLGDNFLLTIGRDATPTGQARGLQLQIFDVTNGAAPALTHRFVYSSNHWGGSEAENDHKAFTYFAEKKLLAFPYYGYSNTGATQSALELFEVDVNTGFRRLGAVDQSSLIVGDPRTVCGGYWLPYVRRGGFLENFAYAVSYAGIVMKDINALTGDGFQVAFSTPEVNEGYGPRCY